MRQVKIIDKMNVIFQKNNSIKSVILIGSFGRKKPKANSDVDYQIIVDNSFNNDVFFTEVKEYLGNELMHSLFLENKNKWCFYVTNYHLIIEVFICRELSELDKYYLGSKISNPNDAIVFDKTNNIFNYLLKITQEEEKNLTRIQKAKVEYLITEFQNRFEACSSNHAKSDGYKFNVLFSHSLNAVVRLIYLCYGAKEHDYMPPNFLTNFSYKHNLEIEYLGTMDLRLANEHKRKLLDLFIEYLPIAIKKFNIQVTEEKIIGFLENVYTRDFIWNFRDISKFNPKIKQGLVYRSAALCLFQKDSEFATFLKTKNIKSIIDLRADREIEELSYLEEIKNNFYYVKAPFDPWNQSIEFQTTYNQGTNIEIAYQFFGIECKSSIKHAMETIINEKNGAILIHCHAGKDRTGIVVALLHLLSGTDCNTIYSDYLASEMDTKKEYLNIIFDIIKEKGGVEPYLIDCGLQQIQIEQLKQKLKSGNER